MRPLGLGTIRRGDPLRAAPINRAFRALESLARSTVAGDLEGAYGTTSIDLPRYMDARLTSNLGGGNYNYQRIQGNGSGGWQDDSSDSGQCWEYNLNANAPASATAGTGSTVVELKWNPQSASWRFQADQCS